MSEPERSRDIVKQARSLMKERRHRDAIKLFNQIFPEVEQNYKLSWDLGWSYFWLRRFDEARKHLIRADNLAPNNWACKWALGLVYLKKKQFKEAEALLAESVRKKDFFQARAALALAYLSQGKIVEAEKTHLEGIELKPKASERYETYAAFLSDVGREAESEAMIKRAKELRGIH